MADLRANLGAHRATPQIACPDCGKPPEQRKHERHCPKAKRARNNRQRGNAYERELTTRLGIQRVGQYGGPEDVKGEWLIVQAKVGGYFPERPWGWLQALPANADQLRAVVIGDAPGGGHRRREVVILDLQDFIDWFGKGDTE